MPRTLRDYLHMSLYAARVQWRSILGRSDGAARQPPFEPDMFQERVVAGILRTQAAGKHCGRPRKPPADKALVAAKELDQGWG